MKKLITIFFVLLTGLFLPQLGALNRDYLYDSNFGTYQHACLEHCPMDEPEGIDIDLLENIPNTEYECWECEEMSIYFGYLDHNYKKYLPHLKQQLIHNDCSCLWPEFSVRAARISDFAYLLFEDLISTTALSNLLKSETEQKRFIKNSRTPLLNKHGLTLSFIVQQFRFSHYYHICQDIKKYVISNYEEREAEKIKDKLEDILEALYPKFFALYNYCYGMHPSADIKEEIQLMKLLVNDVSAIGLSLSTSSILHSSALSSDLENSIDVDFIFSVTKSNEFKPITDVHDSEKIEFETEEHYSLLWDQNFDENSKFIIGDEETVDAYSPQSDIFLGQGTIFNDLLLYNEAIQFLTQAIKLNPLNRDAYVERAMAYFETNQLLMALQDYELAKSLTIVPPFKLGSYEMVFDSLYIPENKINFSQGLLSGTLEGAKVSTSEFIPSIFSSCRGILHGLWSFVCSPIEVSREMVNTAYAIGAFVSSHSTSECLHCVVPELKELSLSWHQLNDYSRGEKIGYIIGKYGVDIFAPIGALKGVSKVRALKRANTMLTLESCAASQAKRAKILEESSIIATKRQSLIAEVTTKGKIVTKSSNVKFHIMTPQHHWDKLISLTGNVEKDFMTVSSLLEKEWIIDKKYICKIPQSFPKTNPKIIRTDHKKFINNQEVYAVFETYIETNETYLKNAWVITE